MWSVREALQKIWNILSGKTLNILKYQQGVAKLYKYYYDVSASSDLDVEIDVPSGYNWIIRRFRIQCADNTKCSNVYIDDNIVSWGPGVGADAYIDSYWGTPMEIICRNKITFTFTNTGTSEERSWAYLWVIEMPETVLLE